MQNSKIISEIKHYKYVSFDIFDTLLKRNVSKPTDIFDILQEKGKLKYGSLFDDFKIKRIKAEQSAKENIFGEITLKDIYQYFLDLPSNVLSWSMDEEEKLEYKYCTINQAIKPIYEYCLKNKKRIEIISDMYLSQDLIEKMLNKIGIKQWDNLYLSNSLNKTKYDGSIYEYVLQDLKISPNRLIHIGDNPKSDIKSARKNGIKAISVPTHTVNIKYYNRKINNIWDNVAREFINNNILEIEDKEKLGFETMGPLLFGFCSWLTKQVKKENIKKIYFFSRDGQILKRAFDTVNSDSNIKTYYFYASRRVFQVPPLAYSDMTYENFITRSGWTDKFNFGYFLKSLGIEDVEIQKKLAKKYKISLTEKNINGKKLKENKKLKNVFNKEKDIIKDNAQKELDCLKGYIEQNDMYGKVAIVDIGWLGNSQRNLQYLLNRENLNTNLIGFYVGIDIKRSHYKKIKMNGYCFAPNYNENLYYKEYKVFNIFEETFLADHGSVRRLQYNPEKHKYIPELYPFEQKDQSKVDILRNYQNGALRFVKEISKQIGLLDISSNFAIGGMLEQFLNPFSDDAKRWGNIMFKDITVRPFIMGNYYYSILLHPRKFIEDYKNSIWKEGYLSVHLKHRYNYERLVDLLHKF